MTTLRALPSAKVTVPASVYGRPAASAAPLRPDFSTFGPSRTERRSTRQCRAAAPVSLIPIVTAGRHDAGPVRMARLRAADAVTVTVRPGSRTGGREQLVASALAEGDTAAAIEIGMMADAEGTELGVDREMPLIRAVLARALLAAGD